MELSKRVAFVERLKVLCEKNGPNARIHTSFLSPDEQGVREGLLLGGGQPTKFKNLEGIKPMFVIGDKGATAISYGRFYDSGGYSSVPVEAEVPKDFLKTIPLSYGADLEVVIDDLHLMNVKDQISSARPTIGVLVDVDAANMLERFASKEARLAGNKLLDPHRSLDQDQDCGIA